MTINKTHYYQPSGEFTVTTTGNIDDLDFEGCGVIRMNNATLSTIRGIKAGYPGQILTIISIGAGQVDFAHQNTNSLAVNRLINFVTSGITPLAAGVGSAIYQYDGTTSRWRLAVHEQGAAIVIPFVSGDFTAGGLQTWTVDSGDVLADTYYIIGRMLEFQFFYNLTSVGGTPNPELLRLLPNGYSISSRSQFFFRLSENGNVSFSLSAAVMLAAGTEVRFRAALSSSVNWVGTTNATSLEGAGKINLV